jgi:hypothetical protein
MRVHRGLGLAAAGAAAAVVTLASVAAARAFCGFYVNSAGTKLYNNATTVALMREGTRTVLSMQNSYEGPPEDFAMVVPVPVVLKKADVKTLPREIFDRLDALAAPRLVEYWEADPCAPWGVDKDGAGLGGVGYGKGGGGTGEGTIGLGVTVLAKFAVGEYEIVILSAKDSVGLDTWLRLEGYKIPAGAEPLLRPYVTGGSKFFVAKVDVTKVKMEDGRAKLSPLRVHYDSPEFSLPVRLGLVNSSGTQDLIVHILARNSRYEVANYPNVTIPTNLDVAEAARDSFAPFYAALFDATAAKHPGAVVTEYAWQALSCDPCPVPPLDGSELATLGSDVLPRGHVVGGGDGDEAEGLEGDEAFVLTRLHVRYGADALGEDLVFRKAPAIVGGREEVDKDGKLEHGAKLDEVNNFQARYVVRHPWTGPIACTAPRRGLWGGPPAGPADAIGLPLEGGGTSAKPARDLATAKRGASLASFVRSDVPELGLLGLGAAGGYGAAASPGAGTGTGAGAAGTASGTAAPGTTAGGAEGASASAGADVTVAPGAGSAAPAAGGCGCRLARADPARAPVAGALAALLAAGLGAVTLRVRGARRRPRRR